MDRSSAEATAVAFANQRFQHPGDTFAVVPGSTVEKPYGWVCSVQPRRFLETGDDTWMAVGLGPLVVLGDGTVHTLGSARPPEEEVYAFEAEHGLRGARAGAAVPVPPVPDSPPAVAPVWVGAQQGDQFPVLALTGTGLVSVLLRHAEVEEVLRCGPELLEGAGGTTIPVHDIDRIRTGDGAELLVERRGDVNVKVAFGTPEERDEAFTGLHRLLAPGAPVERLRRPLRQFVEAAGLGALFLGIGLTLPWMVETGQIDRAQWLAATVFNTVGPGGFRLIGAALAAACLVWLTVIVFDNPVRAGYRVQASRQRAA